LSQLLELLDGGEAYTMRNAVLSMLGAMLTSVLLTERTESNLRTRDQLLDILEERINDVSAYTRKCALQVGCVSTVRAAWSGIDSSS
jgi:condensin complex subunit 1